MDGFDHRAIGRLRAGRQRRLADRGIQVRLFFRAENRRSGPAFERHQRQLLFYCHLWRPLGNSPVAAALVYVDLAGGEEMPRGCQIR